MYVSNSYAYVHVGMCTCIYVCVRLCAAVYVYKKCFGVYALARVCTPASVHIHMIECVYILVRVCTQVYMNAWCERVYAHVWIYVREYKCICARFRMYTHAFVYKRMRASMCICAHLCMLMCVLVFDWGLPILWILLVITATHAMAFRDQFLGRCKCEKCGPWCKSRTILYTAGFSRGPIPNIKFVA